jgi:hypothetical protein
MKETSAKSNATRFALASVLVHACVVALHSAAHQVLGVEASTAQLVFIVAVIMLAPLVAALLLWRKAKAAGALLLAASMAGSFIFGVYNHFMAFSPDHVSHVAGLPQKSWSLIFQVTAALLALVELVGTSAGIRLMRKAD